MGLRLFWESERGRLISFVTVRAFILPRRQLLQMPGRGSHRELPLDTGLMGTGTDTPGEGIEPPHFQGKLLLDKTKKDFYTAVSLLRDNEKDQAAAILRQVLERDEHPDVLFALAICTGDPQEQLESIDRALRLRSRFTSLCKEVGIALCATIDVCDGRLLRLMNDEPGLELLASEVFQSHGKVEDAWRLLEGSQHADVDLFRFSRGDILIRLRRYDEAIDELRKLLTIEYLAGPATYLMGLALDALGYHSAAVQLYRVCLKNEVVSCRLEAAIRRQMIGLLEKEEKMWLAGRERERLAALEALIKEM
jgi:tetratricopeptide (TPR) repeat protein